MLGSIVNAARWRRLQSTTETDTAAMTTLATATAKAQVARELPQFAHTTGTAPPLVPMARLSIVRDPNRGPGRPWAKSWADT